MGVNDNRRSPEFVDLLGEHGTQVFSFIRASIRRDHDAEDVYQQTVMAMWEAFGSFQTGSNFRAWACQIAKFRILRYYDSQRGRRQFSEPMLDLLVESRQEPARADERIAALRRCIAHLTAADRQLLQERYMDGSSVNSLADELQRSSQSICNSLRRIRAKLFRCVESQLAGGTVS